MKTLPPQVVAVIYYPYTDLAVFECSRKLDEEDMKALDLWKWKNAVGTLEIRGTPLV